jgi:2-oxoglutarate dehydrogenase E2 component (dihydrolipoamide succinyltransferase)
MTLELKVPEVGESVREVQVLRWKAAEGDRVDEGDELVEIETEKATLPIPAPASGVLGKILVGDGEFAEVGDVLARIETRQKNGQSAPGDDQVIADEADSDSEVKLKNKNRKKEKEQRKEQKAVKKELRREKRRVDHPAEEGGEESSDEQDTAPTEASREDSDPENISERPGRDRERDARRGERLSRSVDRNQAPPAVEPGRGERVEPMSMLRRTIARRLVAAQQQMALVSTFNEIDMQQVMELRKKCGDSFKARHGVKLGLSSFFVKAVVAALQDYPRLNAELRNEDIVYRDYVDAGVAMDTEKGLVVPVVRDCQSLRFADIERALDDFAGRAREGKLGPDELSGGTFTISNGGIFGSLLSTPIVNPPQSGVLGLHAIEERPVAIEGQVVIRPMMYVALTYDHRIVDGREAVGFLRRVKEVLEMPSRLLVDS